MLRTVASSRLSELRLYRAHLMAPRNYCTKSFELPEHVKERLMKQLQDLYPSKKPRLRNRKKNKVSDSSLDDEYPLKNLDVKHALEEGDDLPQLKQVAEHKDVVRALSKRKRLDTAKQALAAANQWGQEPEGASHRHYLQTWEAKKALTDPQSLLDSEMKRSIPLEHLEDDQRVALWGKAPSFLLTKDELDSESLAFVLRSSLDGAKKPWERGDNPYDKSRLRDLLERKVQIDKMSARLGEIEAMADTKLGPEYNYLRLKGKHMFHTYLDDLAALRKDIMHGLVEEAEAEWKMFEEHESQRIQRIVQRYASKEAIGPASGQPALPAPADQPANDYEPAAQAEAADSGEAPAAAPAAADEAKGNKPGRKKKSRAAVQRERERRFKEKVEKREVAAYAARLRGSEADATIEEAHRDSKGELDKARHKLLWGTLPPGREVLEYQAHSLGTQGFRGWSWRRPVYYVPAIPWRSRKGGASGAWPYTVDDLELPMDWEENYEHFPYYKRQQLWEDKNLDSALPSTDRDWPSREQEFLDVYLSKHDYVHPGNWDVKLGREKPSKYKTLRSSIFEDKFYMSPYENPDFDRFMHDPTSVPSHKLGMDLLGF
ncbi:hypothetical protein DIPPA_00688 [Diplonema papillatum]|nr:hypothetical protein DIPPA_00688 [Diplonema papillatum]